MLWETLATLDPCREMVKNNGSATLDHLCWLNVLEPNAITSAESFTEYSWLVTLGHHVWANIEPMSKNNRWPTLECDIMPMLGQHKSFTETCL